MIKVAYISDIQLFGVTAFGGIKASLKTIDMLKDFCEVDVYCLNGHKKTDRLKKSSFFNHSIVSSTVLAIKKALPYDFFAVSLKNRKHNYETLSILEKLHSNQYDIIILNSVFLFPFFDSEKHKIIIDSLDLMSDRQISFLKSGIKPWFKITEKEEMDVFSQIKGVLSIQEDEKEKIQPHNPNVVVFPRPWKINHKGTNYSENVLNKKKLVFVGGNSNFNIDALNWFIEHVLGSISEYYDLYVYGLVCSSITRKHNALHLIGEFESHDDVYSNSYLSINPIYYGSGLKTKNIESISYGVPVITTDVGIQGMQEFLNSGIYTMKDNSPSEWIDFLVDCEISEKAFTNDIDISQKILIFKFGRKSQLETLKKILN
ncbi:glycosyltransferase [Vibrio cyclitrophicus]